MLDLAALSNLAEIVSTVTVVGGGVFALIQLREYRISRRNTSTAELMRSFYDPEFARAIRLIKAQPDGITAAELRQKGAEYEEAAIIVATRLETIGLLAYKGITSFWMVREIVGGLTVLMWRKLQHWTVDVRSENQQPSWAEWFQWLAERLVEHASYKETQPAYLRCTSWKPRG